MVEAEQDVLVGINEVKAKLEQRMDFRFETDTEARPIPGLVFFRGRMPCTEKEFSEYGWELLPDGNSDYEDPQEENNHCMSALRYAVYTHPRKARQGYRAYRVAGI